MPAGPAAQSPAVAAGPAGPAHPAGVAAPTEVASLPAQPPLAQPGGEGPNPAVPPGPSTEPAPLPPEDLGRLETGGEVLLKFDAGKGAWERVSGAALLKSQDRLLALPVFRPVISLPGKLRLQLIDGTLVQLLPSDPRGVPGVAVEYGQLILETDSETGASLRLRAGERLGVVTLTDAKSRVAIQVGRMEGSTADPETQPAPLAVDLYATQGKVLWQEGDLAPVAVSAPLELSLERQPLEAVAVTRLPDWANASLDTVDALDRRAAAALDKALDGTRGVTLVLRELADRPQREVSWLALRCLAHLGDYGLMVAALNNPDLKGFWPDYIEQLRAGVRRNPLSAAQVRTAMEKLYGPQGADLYELLWRYSDQGVSSEEATRLVRLLEDETLAVRVLSSWNLKRITGLGLYYQPEQTPAKRAPSVQKWKERLQSNPTLRGRSGPETEPPLGAPPAESGVLPSP